MFKISAFSRLSQVSTKTLRYYDQIGLLKPAHTDPSTGYRYYTAEQLFRLNRILAFKDLGFTLEQILLALDEQLSPAHIRGMFRLKQAELRGLIEREQARLARIESRLLLIEREGDGASEQDVVLKSVKPLLVASRRARASLSSLPALFEELDDALVRCGLSSPVTSPHLLLWYSNGNGSCGDETETLRDVEVACILSEPIPEQEQIRVHLLPAMETAASVMHRCQPQSICSALVDLGFWMEHNGYTLSLAQPCREVYLTQEANHSYVTEGYIPVEHA